MAAGEGFKRDAERFNMVTGICLFLKEEISPSSVEDSASLAVAIQCLEAVYGFNYNNYARVKRIEPICLLNTRRSNLAEAEASRMRGNDFMTAKQYAEAVRCYTRAINLDCSTAIYYCNRAAAYCHLKDFNHAIADSQTAIKLDITYSKAYGRLGYCYMETKQYVLAAGAYNQAFKLDPTNVEYRNRILALMNHLVHGHPTHTGQTVNPNAPGNKDDSAGTSAAASTSGCAAAAADGHACLHQDSEEDALLAAAREVLSDDEIRAVMIEAVETPGEINSNLQHLLSASVRRCEAFRCSTASPSNDPQN